MTGTSLDGLDVALAAVTGRGLNMSARCVGRHSESLGDLRDELAAVAGDGAFTSKRYVRAARQLGALHASAVRALCAQHLPADASLDFVAAHGQTIYHAPGEGDEAGVSWQLFDPWPVVRGVGAPVVYDFRQADLIAGGEGAPITPMADWVVFRDAQRSRAVVNLGGICNVTWLPAGGESADVDGGDVGPCNLLLDGLAARLFDVPYDGDGSRAASGVARETLAARVQERIDEAVQSSRTLGREQFSASWVDALVRDCGDACTDADLLASAVQAVGARIAGDARVAQADDVILAGGGARNRALTSVLAGRLPHACVQRSDALGVPIESREAFAMAVLGALSADGVAITLPRVTGAREPGVAGVWVG